MAEVTVIVGIGSFEDSAIGGGVNGWKKRLKESFKQHHKPSCTYHYVALAACGLFAWPLLLKRLSTFVRRRARSLLAEIGVISRISNKISSASTFIHSFVYYYYFSYLYLLIFWTGRSTNRVGVVTNCLNRVTTQQRMRFDGVERNAKALQTRAYVLADKHNAQLSTASSQAVVPTPQSLHKDSRRRE